MRASTLIVVNPASAGGRTGRRWPAIRAVLEATGIHGEPHLTTVPGEATAVVREAVGAGCERVVVVGGDGTLNEVVNGCFTADGAALERQPLLGLVPCGTGGDFARSLGLPRSVEAAAWVVAAGRARLIDAGCIDFASGRRRHFVNVADCGLGGAVVAQVNASGAKRGGAAGSAVFLWHSLLVMLTAPAVPCTVTVDGAVQTVAAQSVVVANGRCFGGGMRVAPHAILDDGRFDVVIVGEASRAALLAGVPSLYRGRHLGRPGVRLIRGAVVDISADPAMLFDVEGEQVGATPARITCLRHALRVMAPASGVAASGA